MPFDPRSTSRSIKLDFDDAVISPTAITADGFADFIGTAKIGDVVLDYPLEAPLVKQWVPAEEALSEEALASIQHQPIVNSHPRKDGRRVFVDKHNAKEFLRGVVKRAWREGKKMRVDLRVYDAELLADIQAGKVDLSTGADCDTVPEPGITPDGVPYDAVQRGHRYNHIAVEYRGRNPGARLTADGQDGMDEIIALIEGGKLSPEDKKKLHLLTADDSTMPVVEPVTVDGTADPMAALAKRLDSLEASIKALTASKKSDSVELDDATMAKLSAKVAASAAKGLRSIVEARDLARPILGTVKADAADDVAALHRDVIVAVFPDQKAEADADYAKGRADSLARGASIARAAYNRQITNDSADSLDRIRSVAPKGREEQEKALAEAFTKKAT